MWKVEDVDNHKKGLTDKQKKQWCRLANGVLKRCMEKGGTEEECAVKAIKQANGVVNVNSTGKYATYKSTQKLDYDIKITTHEGRANLVVPVVMMVEGVHSGSQGPILHTIEELGRFPESWNGIPVVIYHPQKEGEYVSANSPDVLEEYQVGKVFNTIVDDKKLKAEVWFDEEKLNKISEGTLISVNETKELEVSLGMFTDNEAEEGTWHGEKYVAIAHNHRPDHLAILPDQIGACSCADGCGIGANNSNDMKTVKDMISALSKAGFSINQIGNNAEEGYNEKMQMVYDKLRSLDKEFEDEEGKHHYTYNYLEEMYDDYLIYSVSGDNNRKMYKQEYKIESGKIEFVGAPEEVHRKVEYVVNTSLTESNINTKNKEDKNMSENKCPKCLEKVNALIANEKSPWKEADREWLLSLNEDQLTKISAPEVKEVEKVVEKTIEVNKLTPAQEADLALVANQRKERKSKMVKTILDNTKNVWDEATLNNMSEEVLEKVFKSVEKVEPGNFSLNGEKHDLNTNSGSGGKLFIPGVKVE